jgi:phenylpropionate dioxygenase-like ring-hydroxylating dioxygenase large terminal subunit
MEAAMPVVEPRPTLVHGPAPVPPGRITAERYVSTAWLDSEAERLWNHVWFFACLERDVTNPGDFAVVDVGRESIIVSCSPEGAITAMFNVCQHRGARIVTGSGHTEMFTCPYHGWRYRTDGRLVVVPDHQRFSGGVDRHQCSLRRLRVDVLAGLVWVTMDPELPELRDWLGGVAERLEPYQVESMELTGDQTVNLDCNWKAVYDNFGELYHVEHIHPQHQEIFDCPTAQIELFTNGHTGVVIDGHTVNTKLPIPDEPTMYHAMALKRLGADPEEYRGRVLDIRRDVQKLKRERGASIGYDYDAMTDERLTDIEQYNVFPNTMITVQPDDALVARARPHPTDPNRCLWDKFTFVRRPDPAVAAAAGVPYEGRQDRAEVTARPEHDEFDHQDIIEGRKTMAITIDQDIHYIRDIQAGMHSRGFDAAVLSDEEVRIQHYHDWMDHVMGVR